MKLSRKLIIFIAAAAVLIGVAITFAWLAEGRKNVVPDFSGRAPEQIAAY